MQYYFLLLFPVFFVQTQASTFFFEQPALQGHPGQCYTKDETMFVNVGEHFYDRNVIKCGVLTCSSVNGETLSVDVNGCVKQATPEGCKLVPGDKNQLYPNCCSTVQCGGGARFRKFRDRGRSLTCFHRYY